MTKKNLFLKIMLIKKGGQKLSTIGKTSLTVENNTMLKEYLDFCL